MSGFENVTLLTPNLPAHTHTALMSTGEAERGAAAVIAASGTTNTGPLDLPMAPTTITPTGNNVPHENMQPYLVMNYIIALEGIYPSRP